MRGRPQRIAAVLLLAALAVAGVPAATPAAADPGYPTANDVRAAQAAAGGKAAEIARINRQLAAASHRMDRADLAVSKAAEGYDQARIELQRRTLGAGAARAAAASAEDRLAGARVELGRMASQAYRYGGVSDLQVMLSPSGPQDVLDRATMLRTLSEQRGRLLERAEDAQSVADAMQRQADQAVKAQEAAAQALAAARVRAEHEAAAARLAVAAATSQEQALTVQLAKLEKVSVALERQRRAGVEAARQARLRDRARHRSPSGGDTASGGSGSSSGSSSGASGSGGSGGFDTNSGGSGGGSGDSGGGSGGSGGAGGAPDPGQGSSEGSASAGRTALAWAKSQIGKPYQWGGAGPGSYDCSGLTMRAWERAGVSLPHSSRMQYGTVGKVSYSAMRPGDLIFWATDPSDPSTIHHVALYAGGGMMVEAPATGLDVRLVAIRWNDTMPMAGRP
jgi:cell wall-associated NlpC family hydrolase